MILGLQVLLLAGYVVILRKADCRKSEADTAEDLQKITEAVDGQFRRNREELQSAFSSSREESSRNFALQSEQVRNAFTDFMKFLQEFRDAVRQAEKDSARQLNEGLQNYGDRSDEKLSRLASSLEENITRLRESLQEENRNNRQEQQEFQNRFQEGVQNRLESTRDAVDARLKDIQQESAEKLEQMKKTVDEKLQSSMEKHFNESFKLISERLEQVHKGLGEMQSLAAGVGDLKKVLTNVKTRGNLGEIQLSGILEQYLAPDQYAANISTAPGSSEVVEFAVKMPGKMGDEPVYLPIDSKFPVEDYQRLQECYEAFPRMSPEVKKAQESFARTVKKCASDIHDKYIYPPRTTPFGMMFVPSEGIYAEILRLPGLFEQLQNDFKISVVGPSNLVAFLNALQMGFKTLAIEKRSNEVWNILGAVKTEFAKFGDEMDATRKSLQAVVNHVDKIGTRSRALERQLRDVQALPETETVAVLQESTAPEA
ncbi:MAG: DNA recombination protein RmuC [Lentisphaeria bacterium]|nr:DNA recombination protein RmuC [Lentisphaeria bacterium]